LFGYEKLEETPALRGMIRSEAFNDAVLGRGKAVIRGSELVALAAHGSEVGSKFVLSFLGALEQLYRM
jgi:hypothetical protein